MAQRFKLMTSLTSTMHVGAGAAARNSGARGARGERLFFVDPGATT
jgi:hypothetical protein